MPEQRRCAGRRRPRAKSTAGFQDPDHLAVQSWLIRDEHKRILGEDHLKAAIWEGQRPWVDQLKLVIEPLAGNAFSRRFDQLLLDIDTDDLDRHHAPGRAERLALGERSKGIGSGEFGHTRHIGNQLRHSHIVQMTTQRRSDKPKPPPTGSTAAHLEPGSSGSGLILFRTNR